MAVATWTHRRVLDLFPRFLVKSSSGYRPRLEQLAREYGVEARELLLLNVAAQIEVDGIVTPARHRWRSPYQARDVRSERWRRNVAAGLADQDGDGWRMTSRGRDAVARLKAGARAYLAGLMLPADELRRLDPALEELARRIPKQSERALGARRLAPSPEERSAIVKIEQAIFELSCHRDDAHIAAWQAAGYDGLELDTLSQVWEGKATEDEVRKALEVKQDRDEVDRNVERLVRRGDLEHSGPTLRLTPRGLAVRDAIEEDTDHRYFGGWPEGPALARIGEDLGALVAALPQT